MTLLIGGSIRRSGSQNSVALNQRTINGGSGIILTNARSAEPCWILNLAALRRFGINGIEMNLESSPPMNQMNRLHPNHPTKPNTAMAVA